MLCSSMYEGQSNENLKYFNKESQLKTLKINTQLFYNIYGLHLTHPRITVC